MPQVQASSIDDLCAFLQSRAPNRLPLLVGIDGWTGAGKSKLTKTLVKHLGGVLISVDDHIDKGKGFYVDAVRCQELRKEVLSASSGFVVLDGVCLRTVAARCTVLIQSYVYVRRLGPNGIWRDEGTASGAEPAGDVKRRELELLASIEGDQALPSLTEELIDYHCEHRPYQAADVVFDMKEEPSSDEVD